MIKRPAEAYKALCGVLKLCFDQSCCNSQSVLCAIMCIKHFRRKRQPTCSSLPLLPCKTTPTPMNTSIVKALETTCTDGLVKTFPVQIFFISRVQLMSLSGHHIHATSHLPRTSHSSHRMPCSGAKVYRKAQKAIGV